MAQKIQERVNSESKMNFTDASGNILSGAETISDWIKSPVVLKIKEND